MAYTPPTTDYTSTGVTTTVASGLYPWFGVPGDDAHDVVRIAAYGDLATDTALTDLVLIALFSWRRARDSDPVEDGNRQGWWGADADGFGSRLWLLAGAPVSSETARTAEDYVQEALRFLVTEGIASSVTASASIVDHALGLEIAIKQPTNPDLVIRFRDLWEVLRNG